MKCQRVLMMALSFFIPLFDSQKAAQDFTSALIVSCQGTLNKSTLLSRSFSLSKSNTRVHFDLYHKPLKSLMAPFNWIDTAQTLTLTNEYQQNFKLMPILQFDIHAWITNPMDGQLVSLCRPQTKASLWRILQADQVLQLIIAHALIPTSTQSSPVMETHSCPTVSYITALHSLLRVLQPIGQHGLSTDCYLNQLWQLTHI